MRRPDAQGGGEEGLKRRQSVLELPGVSQLHRYTQMGVEVIAMEAAFDIRRPTTVVRHSTADSRLLNVGRRPAVGCRMSNVVLWKDPATTQEDAVKDAVTTQEVTPKTGEVALKDAEVAPKTAPKAREVAPKGDEVAVKNAVAAQETTDAPQENALGTTDLVLALINEKPEISLVEIAEKLGLSRDGVKYHIDRLKQSVGLIHDGPTKKGRWIVTNP